MTFILAVLLFVVAGGLIDRGLPWPAPRSRESGR